MDCKNKNCNCCDKISKNKHKHCETDKYRHCETDKSKSCNRCGHHKFRCSAGKAATITVGTTYSLPTGSSAVVTNSGSDSNAIFNFGIPIGTSGTSATITAGTATALPTGSSPTVTNTGTTSAAIFNFGIPAGQEGEQGIAATITVGDVESVPEGSPATVTNSGTESAAIFNFGIPEGATGSAATINVGTVTSLDPGSLPTVTNSGTTSAAIFNFGIPSGQSGIMNYSDFYALMPSDNSAKVAVGGSVAFPNIGVNNGVITASSDTNFNLPNIGVYEVNFQVSITQAGQLAISLGGVLLPQTVVGRATGTSQIFGTSLIQTTNINTILSIVNPVGNSTALTVTPLAGGANSVSAHLVIKQIALITSPP